MNFQKSNKYAKKWIENSNKYKKINREKPLL
jgi:hypothetical protein